VNPRLLLREFKFTSSKFKVMMKAGTKKKAHNASDATASTIGNHIILCVTYLFLRISIGLLVREIL
jgi:hypothetical protein